MENWKVVQWVDVKSTLLFLNLLNFRRASAPGFNTLLKITEHECLLAVKQAT